MNCRFVQFWLFPKINNRNHNKYQEKKIERKKPPDWVESLFVFLVWIYRVQVSPQTGRDIVFDDWILKRRHSRIYVYEQTKQKRAQNVCIYFIKACASLWFYTRVNRCVQLDTYVCVCEWERTIKNVFSLNIYTSNNSKWKRTTKEQHTLIIVKLRWCNRYSLTHVFAAQTQMRTTCTLCDTDCL